MTQQGRNDKWVSAKIFKNSLDDDAAFYETTNE